MVEGWLRHPSEAWPYEALKRGLPRPFKMGEGKKRRFLEYGSVSTGFHTIRQGAEKALYLPAGRQGGYLFEHFTSDGQSL
jgi:hypothetical protein